MKSRSELLKGFLAELELRAKDQTAGLRRALPMTVLNVLNEMLQCERLSFGKALGILWDHLQTQLKEFERLPFNDAKCDSLCVMAQEFRDLEAALKAAQEYGNRLSRISVLAVACSIPTREKIYALVGMSPLGNPYWTIEEVSLAVRLAIEFTLKDREIEFSYQMREEVTQWIDECIKWAGPELTRRPTSHFGL